MQLSMVNVGETCVVERILGREKVQKQMTNLGFVPGAKVTVVSRLGKSTILLIKDARVGVGRELTDKVIVRREEI